MSKLAVNVVLAGPDGAPFILHEGDEVPDWAKDEIGDHCLEQGKPKAADKASDDEAQPKAGRSTSR